MITRSHNRAPVANRRRRPDFDVATRVLRAVGQPFRLAIVHCLRDGERCVCDIAQAVGAERSNVSRHLAVLANAGVLTHSRQGLLVLYKLKTPCILGIFDCVGGVVRGDAQDVAAGACTST